METGVAMRFSPVVIIVTLLLVAQGASAGVYLTIVRRPERSGPSAREVAANEARRQVRLAETQLTRAYTAASLGHPIATQLRQARIELAQASIEHEELRQQLIRKFSESTEIRQLNQQIRDHSDALYREKDEPKRFALARQLLEVRTARSRLIAAHLAEDVDLTIAQADVQERMNKVRALELEYQSAILADDRFYAARQQLESARRQLAGR